MFNQFYLSKDYYFQINGNDFELFFNNACFSSYSACLAWPLKSP